MNLKWGIGKERPYRIPDVFWCDRAYQCRGEGAHSRHQIHLAAHIAAIIHSITAMNTRYVPWAKWQTRCLDQNISTRRGK
jgi:hypothetical protein